MGEPQKIIALGLFLIFAISACASEEPQSVAPKASIQETNDVEQGAANNEEPSSTATATTAPVKNQSTTTMQPKNDQNSDQSQPLTLLATAFVDVADYWGVQPFATRTNQLGVQFHNGIDYFTNQEQVGVQAVSDGRVMFVDIYERQPDGAFQINLAWQAPSGEIISYSLEPSAGPAERKNRRTESSRSKNDGIYDDSSGRPNRPRSISGIPVRSR